MVMYICVLMGGLDSRVVSLPMWFCILGYIGTGV